MPLSKNKIKFFHSLERKKTRDELGLFIAEGEKLIQELFEAEFQFHTVIGTTKLLNKYPNLKAERIEVAYEEIKKISLLKTPQELVAICYLPKQEKDPEIEVNNLVIALDNIQDPGNLGTIIRLASWFGISQIVCSNETADCYNPKVIQATMGAIAHVKVCYTCLEDYLMKAKQEQIPVYGTFLDGENIYQKTLIPSGIVVMGNEGNGISKSIEALIDRKLFIPSFSTQGKNVESLNVSMATAIICSEFRRNSI